MICDKCSPLLERLSKARDREALAAEKLQKVRNLKDYYARENKRLREQVRNQRQKLEEWEKRNGNH